MSESGFGEFTRTDGVRKFMVQRSDVSAVIDHSTEDGVVTGIYLVSGKYFETVDTYDEVVEWVVPAGRHSK